MHTELTTHPSRHEHPPHTVRALEVRRVSLVDRTALHLGVALIKWGRRRSRVVDREQAMLAHRAYLARQESERLRTQHEALYLTRVL